MLVQLQLSTMGSSQLNLEGNATSVENGGRERGASRRELEHAFSVEPGFNQFSTAHGVAWKDALRAAEELLQTPGKLGTAAALESGEGNGGEEGSDLPEEHPVHRVEQSEFSLEDLIGELEAAEEDSKQSPRKWQRVLKEIQMDDRAEQHHYDLDSRRRRSSGSASQYSTSEASTEILSERAAQWGYGVTLRNSRDSSPRTSDGSFSGGQIVPGVAKDVQDALTSFQLAFLVCDATDPEFPIRYASAGFTTMTGYTSEEIMGKNCRFLQGPDTNREDVAKVRKVLKNGGIYSGTLLNYKKDGTPFWNLLTISPIKDDTGNVIKYIGMQAEQHSKEQQPRNSKGQKSPMVRPLQAPSFTLREEAQKMKFTNASSAGPALPHRRYSSNSLPSSQPPVAPQKTAPVIERHSAGPELQLGENPQKRMSQRYSLTSNPLKSTRNSSVILEAPELHWRDAALKLKVGLEGAGKTTSFFEPTDTSSKEGWKGQKSKSARLSSKILRFFRKTTKDSKLPLKTVISGKEIFETSDSDDEETKASQSTDNSAQISRFRTRSSTVYSSSAARSLEPNRRPDSGEDDLGGRFDEQLSGKNYSGSSSKPSLPIGDNKRQFCIVHE